MTNYQIIPEHMRKSVQGYIEKGWRPGGFLTAVLCNALKEAAAQADSVNKYRLYDWAVFVTNEIPAIAQGSHENVEAWIAHKGLEGLRDA